MNGWQDRPSISSPPIEERDTSGRCLASFVVNVAVTSLSFFCLPASPSRAAARRPMASATLAHLCMRTEEPMTRPPMRSVTFARFERAARLGVRKFASRTRHFKLSRRISTRARSARGDPDRRGARPPRPRTSQARRRQARGVRAVRARWRWRRSPSPSTAR